MYASHGDNSTTTEAKTVFVLLGRYLPGYKSGGPVRTIENTVARLGKEIRFRVVTSDRDLGDSEPYSGVPQYEWVKVGSAEVMYLKPGLGGLLHLMKLLRSLDDRTILYINSFFSRRFSILAIWLCFFKLCRPGCVILAPRGEFSLGALGLKANRKRLYISAARVLGIYRNIIWQASNYFEHADILRTFPMAGETLHNRSAGKLYAKNRTKVMVAPDLPSLSIGRQQIRVKEAGTLSLVFVSRISPMKNLKGALEIVRGLSGKITLDIYGPLEDLRYWHECEVLIEKMSPNVRVRYLGPVEHDAIPDVFADHDLFLFPTLGENFGHVIFESLSAGCPVLISDRTPWRNLESNGVGWDLPLSDQGRFTSTLQRCVDSDEEAYSQYCSRARQYAINYLARTDTLEANRALFNIAN